MNRSTLAIFIVILLMLPIAIPLGMLKAQSEGYFELVAVIWGSPSTPLCVGPGMQTQMLTVMLKYNGNDALAGLKAELYLPWIFRDALSKTSTAESKYTQVISRNQIIELRFWIDIGKIASAGEYMADLILYSYRNGLWEEINRLTINIPITYTANISIKTPSLTKVYPGFSNLSIYIENSGRGYAYNVSVDVLSIQQVSIIKSSIPGGDISPNTTVGIDIPIYISPSLVGALVPIYLRISYIDACSFSRTFNTVLYLSIEQPPKGPQIIVKATPTTLITGVENIVKVTISNNGTVTARKLAISFEFPQQIVVINGTAKIMLDELRPESSLDVALILMPVGTTNDRTAIQVSTTLSYRDQYDIDRSDRIIIPFTIIRPQTFLTIDVQPESLTAGKVNSVSISIENTGEYPVYGVEASIVPQQSIIVRGFDGKWHIGDLKPGERKSLELYIAIPITVAGSIQISMSLTYTDLSLTLRTEARSIVFSVTPIEKPIAVQITPRELDYGENTIDIVITNSGEMRIGSIYITITSPQLIIKEQGNKWYVGDLEPGEQKSLRLPVFVPSSIGSVTQVTLGIEYRDVTGTLISENIVYSLMVKPVATLLTVMADREQIIPGENNVTIYIRNDGNKPAYNLLVTIVTQQAVLKGLSDRWFIGDLYPGEVRVVTLPLIVPSTVNSIQIGITLSYTDVGGATKSESRSLGLVVRQSLTNIAIWTEPQNLLIGENSITVYVRNDGEISTHDMLLSFTPSQQIIFIGSGERIYIDKLVPGETRVYTLKLMVVATGATILQVPVAISYIDSANIYRTENRIVSFRVSGQPTVINFRAFIEPHTIFGGRYSMLNLTVVNIANRRLDNISLTISSGSIALIGSNGRWYLGSLEPNKAKIISLTVYTNPVQSMQSMVMTVTFTYIDVTGSLTSESMPLTIIVMPEIEKKPLEVSVIPQIIVAGRSSNLTISIRNPNKFEIGPVTLSIAPSTGVVLLSSDIYFIDLIESGNERSVEVSIYVQPTSGAVTLSLPLTISYFDGTTIATLSKNLALFIVLLPTLKVSNYAVLPQTISPGQTFSISLTLVNTGLGSAYNVTVRALPSHIYIPLLGVETFIGEIAKGASTTVTFSFRLSTTVNVTAVRPVNITRTRTAAPPPGTATRIEAPVPPLQNISLPSVNIMITYMDNVGRQYNTTLSIPLTIVAGTTTLATHMPTQSSTNNIALLIIALLVGVTLIYPIIRLRRR